MKNLKLSNKIYVLSVAIILVFSLTISWVYSQLKINLYQGKKGEIQHTVEASWGIIDYYASLANDGVLAKAEAQAAAREAIRHMRFDGDNYFFIVDTQTQCVMHPLKPELEGQDMSNTKDPDGKALFSEMIKVAKASGQGFVDYKWSKSGSTEAVPKISFVKLSAEWGWAIGAGLYLDDVESELSRIFNLILGAVTGVIIFTFLLVFLVARSISIPLGRSVNMIQELEKGNLDLRLKMNQSDEVGQMAKALDGFADNMKDEVLAAFEALANGNLTFEATGVIRHPLSRANAALNDVMGQIQVAGEQISSGSSQVSDSSQSLSQGATESAASLEEITSSMTQMASQTAQNAENAGQANGLALEVKGSAEKGNQQMQNMVSAMNEINEASQDISKIIKTIDEIAFQTNLLALNAAVEAARAGQHGKGFAVVAEEVRNLAARSAKAASETAELIEGSVEKAARGTQIADATAEALGEIVSGVTKVTDLVAEIAAASNEQAQGIGQVSQGLNQIDQVTQQNTASAEESAAAAEELSAQAAQLQQMLQRFTLCQASRGGLVTINAAPQVAQAVSWAEPAVAASGTPRVRYDAAQIDLNDMEFSRY